MFGQPQPGRDFRFTVYGGSGTTKIEADLNQRQVLQVECPDPPCHEMVFIPTNTFGELVVVATDSTGARERWVFAIQTSTSGGGTVSGGTVSSA